ncbi:MAG: hypothetical protein QHI38_01940 [Armatimonadota bacterium]|nr:hypothetical protein [Armatimonadota bacterium]
MASRYPEIDLRRLKTTRISDRLSTVGTDQFAKPLDPDSSVREFLDSLPDILAGRSLRTLVQRIVGARRLGKPVILAMGAHVIKCGLGPIIVDLIRGGVITAVATNGAGAIHDSEVALFGATSEDVSDALPSGTFGTAKETAEFVNGCASRACRESMGFGEALGKVLCEVRAPHAGLSVLAAAYESNIPVTVHVSIGCDIVHMHPSADGAAIGECTHRDFRILTQAMSDLGQGGVLLNIGSAVVLPEVILKALAVLVNLGYDLSDMLGANLDFIQQYRSNKQVVERVREIGGSGISIIGHHELLIPLIAAGVKSTMSLASG